MSGNEAPFEFQISEAMLHKTGLIILGIMTAFVLLGALVSPRDEQGNPILLSPDVRAVQDYRSAAHGWMEEFSSLDSEIGQLISVNVQGDLFTQSRSAEQILQRAVTLAQDVDRTSVPPIAMGLHEKVSSAAMAYVEAARSVLQWVSAPEQTNRDIAVKNLDIARKLKVDIEANQWLTSP
jgi:hypothetical protein